MSNYQLTNFGPLPPPSELPPVPKVGWDVRRKGETLSWRVSHVGDDRMYLVGPLTGRQGLPGYMVIERAEFDEKWERA